MMRLSAIIGLLVILTACGTSPKTNFYTLSTSYSDKKDSAENTGNLSVGVWKVKLPDLLDRKEIVIRENLYEVTFADFSNWGGDLDINMTQVIVDELGQRLHSNQISMSPWLSHRKNDYQIKILVDRFDGMLGGEVVLTGTWSLLDAEGDSELAHESFNFITVATDKTHKEMVAALSSLTIKLADRLSAVIQSQQKI